jgi:hypothetical protein
LNLQGDVIAIFDAEGNAVVSYAYYAHWQEWDSGGDAGDCAAVPV